MPRGLSYLRRQLPLRGIDPEADPRNHGRVVWTIMLLANLVFGIVATCIFRWIDGAAG